jgi:hypothetical protein
MDDDSISRGCQFCRTKHEYLQFLLSHPDAGDITCCYSCLSHRLNEMPSGTNIIRVQPNDYVTQAIEVAAELALPGELTRTFTRDADFPQPVVVQYPDGDKLVFPMDTVVKELHSHLHANAGMRQLVRGVPPSTMAAQDSKKLLKKLKSTSYLTTTMEALPTGGVFKELHKIKDALKQQYSDAAFLNQLDDSSIMLFLNMQSKPGSGTSIHADRMFGVNVAFALRKEDLGNVLAYWLFFDPSPDSIKAVNAFLSSQASQKLRTKFPNGFARPPTVNPKTGKFLQGGDEEVLKHVGADLGHLDKTDMDELVNGCGQHVRLVGQRSGDVVTLNPGWVHSVYNMLPSLKVAFNALLDSQMLLLAVMGDVVGSQLLGQNSAEDYAVSLQRCIDKLVDLMQGVLTYAPHRPMNNV